MPDTFRVPAPLMGASFRQKLPSGRHTELQLGVGTSLVARGVRPAALTFECEVTDDRCPDRDLRMDLLCEDFGRLVIIEVDSCTGPEASLTKLIASASGSRPGYAQALYHHHGVVPDAAVLVTTSPITDRVRFDADAAVATFTELTGARLDVHLIEARDMHRGLAVLV